LYLIFDTETTGLPRSWSAPYTATDNWPRLVQIAWFLLDENHQTLESVNRIVRPNGFTIPADATRVHGITTAIATERGWPLESVLSDFDSAIQRASVVVAHNIEFDSKVVGAEYVRMGRPSPFGRKRKVCTMRDSTDYCGIPGGPRGAKWPTLEELHFTLFRKPFKDAHEAGVDVAACTRCFVELVNRGVIAGR